MLTLTPQARSVAAFTVAVALLIGQLNRITLALVLLFGDAFPSGRSGQFLIALISIAVATAVLGAALSVARAPSTGGWEMHLAQAAVVVAALGLAIAVVGGLGGVVNGSGSLPVNVLS